MHYNINKSIAICSWYFTHAKKQLYDGYSYTDLLKLPVQFSYPFTREKTATIRRKESRILLLAIQETLRSKKNISDFNSTSLKTAQYTVHLFKAKAHNLYSSCMHKIICHRTTLSII